MRDAKLYKMWLLTSQSLQSNAVEDTSTYRREGDSASVAEVKMPREAEGHQAGREEGAAEQNFQKAKGCRKLVWGAMW